MYALDLYEFLHVQSCIKEDPFRITQLLDIIGVLFKRNLINFDIFY